MKKLLLFISLVVFVTAQDKQFLMESYNSIKSAEIKLEFDSLYNNKCNTWLINYIRINGAAISEKNPAVLNKMFTRPELQKIRTTPNGKIKVHYDTTGVNKPAYPIEDFIAEVERSYNYLVNTLKYPAPPADLKEGGDDLYDIYIIKMTDWGVTKTEQFLGNDKYTSYIEIDNDFSDKRKQGMDGAKITIVHELHHAIQIGNYRFSDDIFIHEMTSTAMEEFLYDDVNDYYNEISKYFIKANRTLSVNDGYNLTVLAIYLKDKFGIDFIKSLWENISNLRALTALNKTVTEYGSNFKDIFKEFGQWCYFTNSRAIKGKYFEEAENYPLLKPFQSFKLTERPFEITRTVSSEPVSNLFIDLIDTLTTSNKYIFSMQLSNSDYLKGIDYTFSNNTDFKYGFASEDYVDYSILIPGLYFSGDNIDNKPLTTSFYISDKFGARNYQDVSIQALPYPYPQPFVYSQHNNIVLPVSFNENKPVVLKVYSINFELLYEKEVSLQFAADGYVINWQPLTAEGKKLKTGVYIYTLNQDNSVNKGKIAIIND